jgi:hypothetical protein
MKKFACLFPDGDCRSLGLRFVVEGQVLDHIMEQLGGCCTTGGSLFDDHSHVQSQMLVGKPPLIDVSSGFLSSLQVAAESYGGFISVTINGVLLCEEVVESFLDFLVLCASHGSDGKWSSGVQERVVLLMLRL